MSWQARLALASLAALAACAGGHDPTADGPPGGDAAPIDGPVTDGPGDGPAIDAPAIDAPGDGPAIDAPAIDAPAIDAAVDAAPDATVGILDGGPCLSGTAGATAYRVRWTNAGGTAQVVYEVNGLPDKTRDHTGVYGAIGFTPQYVDTALAQGGLLLDGSDFIDIELSTIGVSAITTARLSIYGRSYAVSTSGSFNWQTFDGVGAAPTNLVSNVVPYAWYTADMTTEISPGDGGILLRVRAGPSSGSLVVNRLELCMQAQ